MIISGLMVSTLVYRLSGLGLSPGQGHRIVFLGKTPWKLVGLMNHLAHMQT